jgi:MoxR-like ATPase
MGERMIAMSTTPNLASIKPSLDKLQAIERELTASLIERDEVIRASLVTLLARQHLVVLGPPGKAKSALVSELSGRISLQNGAGLRSFAYLMTRFTTPEELFGPVSVAGLKRDEYRRITSGKLVEAELVFLDEIFKASSAILNALLKIANERVFHNGDQEMQVPLISLFGASNEMPQGNELEALWDRFLLRFRVGYVTDTGFAKFIRAAAAKHNGQNSNGSQPLMLLQSELTALQQSVAQVAIPNAVVDLIEQLRKDLMSKGIIISDRRWGQALRQQYIILPGVTVLEKLITAARTTAEEGIFQDLNERLDEDCRQKILSLLERAPQQKQSLFQQLQEAAGQPSPEALSRELDALSQVQAVLPQHLDLSDLNPLLIERFASLLSGLSTQAVLRITPVKRQALLVCWLWRFY